ncbi:MAG: hypothetical protein NTV82_09920 [Candidatus Aminicenantes bacterium]|nr:hypothetical protein [Candidatus Aminicenantes bacterium]
MAMIFSTPSQMHCRLAGARGEGEMAGRKGVAVPVAAGGDKRAGRVGDDAALAR